MTDTSEAGAKPESKMFELLTRLEPLTAELQPYVYQRPIGRILHHPLIIEMFLDEERAALINERFRLRKAELAKAVAERNWPKYVFLHERPYRLNALSDALHNGAPDLHQLVAQVWIDSENIWQHQPVWIDIWKSLRDPHLTMDANERTVYEWMPDTITIHRGISAPRRNRRGLSWTRDKERAVFFAHRWRGKTDKPVVLTAEVSKKHVLAFFMGRHEEEVVVLPRNLKNVRE